MLPENYLALVVAATAVVSLAIVILAKIFKLGQTTQSVRYIEEDIKENIKPELKELRADVAILKTDVKVMSEKIDIILNVVRLKPKDKQPQIK